MTTKPEPGKSSGTTHTIATMIHGRYLLAIPDGPGPHPLLVGFHGYGENAEAHLDALRSIPGAGSWALCAVQALHRFYDRKSEEVVGCWMTKQDRGLAIADNVAYVRGVLDALRLEPWAGDMLVYAGFSQGAAMAYRAAAFAGFPSQGLIALGGDLPMDVLETGLKGFPDLLIGTGSQDPWYTPSHLKEDQAKIEAVGPKPITLVFEGGHEWTEAFRMQAGVFLEAVLQGR
jgi:predicted esterase